MILRISLFVLLSIVMTAQALPNGFVYLDEIAPNIIQDLRYQTSYNFVGEPIPGYYVNRCILTKPAALKLKQLQEQLEKDQLGLKVYDCYRPTRSVKAFVRWSEGRNHKMKIYFYPRVRKSQLFNLGYIAAYSGHSRGSTVDITLISNKGETHKGVPACYLPNRARDNSLDMGSNFDCLDKTSHYLARNISADARANRKLLREKMGVVGFRPYAKEWWHFTLRHEPYPRTYFNFPIK